MLGNRASAAWGRGRAPGFRIGSCSDEFLRATGTFAALDLGTTNCRLLIARPVQSEAGAGEGAADADSRTGRGDAIRVVDSFSRIVRLGEGLDAAGSLSDAAMERTIDALAVCAAKLRSRHVTRRRLVATEACRRAANCGVFLDRVRAATGLELEIIHTGEEARLALAGCAPLLDPARRSALVFDIGGGSTEVMWVAVRQDRDGRPSATIRGVVSVPYGVVSLTERFSDRPQDGTSFAEMVALVQDFLLGFDEDWEIGRQLARGGVQMLGSSGTVTTLAAIHLALPRYDRARVDGATLDFAAIERVSDLIVTADAAGRAREPCIGFGRADLMVAGCAILAAICRTWPVGSLRVADRGVREGILAGLMAEARRGAERAAERRLPVAALPT